MHQIVPTRQRITQMIHVVILFSLLLVCVGVGGLRSKENINNNSNKDDAMLLDAVTRFLFGGPTKQMLKCQET